MRVQRAMKGMFAVVNKLFKELNKWARTQNVRPAGAPFLRYHVIDMAGQMDVEVGLPVATPLPGNDRVKPGVLPAGQDAGLIYSGSGLAGNKALIAWARDNGICSERWKKCSRLKRAKHLRVSTRILLLRPSTKPLVRRRLKKLVM